MTKIKEIIFYWEVIITNIKPQKKIRSEKFSKKDLLYIKKSTKYFTNWK